MYIRETSIVTFFSPWPLFCRDIGHTLYQYFNRGKEVSLLQMSKHMHDKEESQKQQISRRRLIFISHGKSTQTNSKGKARPIGHLWKESFSGNFKQSINNIKWRHNLIIKLVKLDVKDYTFYCCNCCQEGVKDILFMYT